MTKCNCKICGETDPVKFYASIRGYCKEHWKERVRQNRASNKAHYQEFDRRRDQLPHRKAMKRAYAATDAGKAAGNRAKKAWNKRNPVKRQANNMVNNAIRDGKLSKGSCECCGSTQVHGHHEDYAKPLEVNWLCAACHKWWHQNQSRFNKGRGELA